MDEVKLDNSLLTEEEKSEIRQNTIHAKGFDLFNFAGSLPTDIPDKDTQITDYNRIKIGVKQLEDAVFELGTLRQARLPFCNKREIMKAIVDRDYRKLR